MLDRPFTDVCCTVSCWALLFSVIIPTVQAMGVEVPAFPHGDSCQHYQQQLQQHLCLQQHHHLNHRQQHSLIKPHTFALTVYLESSSLEPFALTFLADPSPPRKRRLITAGSTLAQGEDQQHLQRQYPFNPYANNGHSTTDLRTRTKRPALHAGNPQQDGSKRSVRAVVMSDKSTDPIPNMHATTGRRATVHGHHSPRRESRHRYPPALLQALERVPPDIGDDDECTLNPGIPTGHEGKQDVQHGTDESLDDNDIYSTVRGLAVAAGMLLPNNSDDLSPQASMPSASLFAIWTKNDLEFAKALWDYWGELDALNRIQMQLGQEEEEEMSNELDHVGFNSPSFRRRRSISPQSQKSTILWKGRVCAATAWDSKDNVPPASTRLQDDISGPIMRFPLSAPMPTMPHQWVALMPCAIKSVMDHAVLQLDASAIILYPTMRANCSRIPALKDSPVPLMILDYESSKQLILTLDSLSYGTMAMATLSMATHATDATRTRSVKAQDVQEKAQKVFGASLYREEYGKLEQRRVTLSLLEIASMVESFKSRAALQTGRILASLGLVGTRYTELKESLSTRPDSFGKENRKARTDVMVSTSYQPLSSNLFSRQGRTRDASVEPDSYDLAAKDDDLERMMTTSQPSPADPALSQHPKASARPDRLAKRVYPVLPQQILDEMQSPVPHKDSGQGHKLSTLWSNNYYQYGGGSSRSTGGLSTKLATILMSTVCGVGVGMFGALLFVVALKVQLFQTSRRSGRSGGQGRLTAQELQAAHQQTMRENNSKKLIPKAVLESYRVQTVLHISSSAIKLSAPTTTGKSRSGMACFFSASGRKYTGDVIGVEGGPEGPEARENAGRQRLRQRRRRRRGRTASGQVLVERVLDECDCENGDESNDNDGGDEVMSGSGADEGVHTDGAVLAETTMGMDLVAAAIATATRQESDHRVSNNRQGHLNLAPPSSSPSSSSSSSEGASSSSSRSERQKGCCSTQKKKKQGELPFANANAQTMCAVCLCEYEVGNKVRTLPCYHRYHLGCIDPWLLNVVSLCPICKLDLWPGSPSPK